MFERLSHLAVHLYEPIPRLIKLKRFEFSYEKQIESFWKLTLEIRSIVLMDKWKSFPDHMHVQYLDHMHTVMTVWYTQSYSPTIYSFGYNHIRPYRYFLINSCIWVLHMLSYSWCISQQRIKNLHKWWSNNCLRRGPL